MEGKGQEDMILIGMVDRLKTLSVHMVVSNFAHRDYVIPIFIFISVAELAWPRMYM